MFIQANSFQKKHILFLGLLFHCIAAWFSYGAHHPDELFQIFEFAGYKLGLNEAADLPWEFHQQMRSGIQPLIVFLFTKACHLLFIYNPFTIAFLLRLSFSLFSFFAVFKLISHFEKEIENEGLKLNLWLLGTLFWCLPYFHARLSSENFSTALFILALLTVLKNIDSQKTFLKLLFAGFLMGLAFLCRFQISFMIAGLFCWLLFVNKTKIILLLQLFFGLILALLFGLLIDHWLYDKWTLSWWNYLDLNLFKHAASQFGEQPFYYFVSETLTQLLPPYSIVFAGLVIIFWIRFRSHVLTWITLPFVILHFFVAHKELRFLFPVLNFLPLIFVLAYGSLLNGNSIFLRIMQHRIFRKSFLIVNGCGLVIFSLLPADNMSQILKAMYNISDNKEALLLYQDQNPYNNSGSLNYFKNTKVKTIKFNEYVDSTENEQDVYYFTEEFRISETIVLNGKTYKKVFSKYPWWFVYFNYNNWLERAGFMIYKKNETV